MAFKLYPDQVEVTGETYNAMKLYRKILLQAATGSGKTAIAINMILRAVAKGKRVIFTVPRKDLLEQTSKTFFKHGIIHSFIASGKDYNPFAQVYIGMVDTMANRVDRLPDVNLVIIDETHFGAGRLDTVVDRYSQPYINSNTGKKEQAWIVGLSATPWKLSGQGMGMWYQNMVQGKSIQWLIDNKRLADYKYYYGQEPLDTSVLGVTAGEFNKGQTASLMESKTSIIGNCVENYRNRAMGNLHIVRCASIKHSQMTAEAFRDDGITFVHVDGKTPMHERIQIFKAYAKREILGLTFCDLLTFGFDLSQASGMDVCIESSSDMKPSKSLAGQMQFWGRDLRYKPKPAVKIDHVNNWREHGLPCSDREWTLENRIQGKKSDKEAAPPSRQCPKCYFVHSPTPSCPDCGHVYEIMSRTIAEVEGDILEMNKEEMKAKLIKEKKAKRIEQGRAETLEDLIRIGEERGYKNPTFWARKVYQTRGRR